MCSLLNSDHIFVSFFFNNFVNFSLFSIHFIPFSFNLFCNHSMSRCLLILQKQLGIVLGISQASFQFYFSIQQLSLGGFCLTHITYSIFLFVKWREEKKVKFPLWAVSMLGCSWPRTFRNFSIKEGGTTCSKWASYLSILRSLSYATMDLEVFWSCINPKWCRLFGKLRRQGG